MATRPIMLTCIMRGESGYLSRFWPKFLSQVSQLHGSPIANCWKTHSNIIICLPVRQHFLFKKYPTCYLCTNCIIVPITCNLKPACKSLGCYSFARWSGYSIFAFVFVFSLEKRSSITIIISILYVGRNLVRKNRLGTWAKESESPSTSLIWEKQVHSAESGCK